MQNITLFSDKDEEKAHKLLDKNAKKSLGQLRSQTGESLGQNDNFPGVPGHQPFLENCRLTTLFGKIWLCNCQ